MSVLAKLASARFDRIQLDLQQKRGATTVMANITLFLLVAHIYIITPVTLL